jgi:hypothetical protein
VIATTHRGRRKIDFASETVSRDPESGRPRGRRTRGRSSRSARKGAVKGRLRLVWVSSAVAFGPLRHRPQSAPEHSLASTASTTTGNLQTLRASVITTIGPVPSTTQWPPGTPESLAFLLLRPSIPTTNILHNQHTANVYEEPLRITLAHTDET